MVDATVPPTAPVTVNLARAGVVVPDLFGLGLRRRPAPGCGEANLEAELMIDTLGHEISQRRGCRPSTRTRPCWPSSRRPATVADPAPTGCSLVVAAAISEEPVVTVPSLVGLTQAEASRALEQIGLRLGKVTVRTT